MINFIVAMFVVDTFAGAYIGFHAMFFLPRSGYWGTGHTVALLCAAYFFAHCLALYIYWS